MTFIFKNNLKTFNYFIQQKPNIIQLKYHTSKKTTYITNTYLLSKSFLSSKTSTSIHTHKNNQNIKTKTTIKHYIKTNKITNTIKLFKKNKNNKKS